MWGAGNHKHVKRDGLYSIAIKRIPREISSFTHSPTFPGLLFLHSIGVIHHFSKAQRLNVNMSSAVSLPAGPVPDISSTANVKDERRRVRRINAAAAQWQEMGMYGSTGVVFAPSHTSYNFASIHFYFCGCQAFQNSVGC